MKAHDPLKCRNGDHDVCLTTQLAQLSIEHAKNMHSGHFWRCTGEGDDVAFFECDCGAELREPRPAIEAGGKA